VALAARHVQAAAQEREPAEPRGMIRVRVARPTMPDSAATARQAKLPHATGG